jgi:hypothetical protein
MSSLPLAFLLMLLVLQASHGFAGLNLCIGRDGHVEIESADAGCCPGLGQETSDHALIQEQAPCASCIDVSLGNLDSGPMAAAGAGMQKVFLSPPLVLERVSPRASAPASAFDQEIPPGISLSAVRSVVLRL